MCSKLRNESCGSVIPVEQPTVGHVKCTQGSTLGKQISFFLALAYTVFVGFCMYVWSTYFALHQTWFETKYSILGDPAIPVHYLIGMTLQRSDGLVGYVECPNRQLYYDGHQSQSHLDQ